MAGHEIDFEWRRPAQNAPADLDGGIVPCGRHGREVLCLRSRWTKCEDLSTVCQPKLTILRCADVRTRTIPVVQTQGEVINVKDATSAATFIHDRINSCRVHPNSPETIEKK